MKKFEGTAAMMVNIGTQRFVLEGYKLWSLEDGEWRFLGEKDWRDRHHGSYLSIAGNPIEIKDAASGLVYLVSIHSFEEVHEVSTEYMLHAIAQKRNGLNGSHFRCIAVSFLES